ncbi:hypothetical protein DFH07DRAFT_952569 [Mycena maculata]|uniref:Uncharacterized protein n=1 Tax=Mycena maculata TaxID=230809 RepID=A0AAD7JY42_9AGAR|nr:hypothetical protein DFH07DRAFT_952569 [Mycena maculata]
MHNLSVKTKKAGEDSDLQTMLENLSREEYEEIKENLMPEEHKHIMKQLDDHTALAQDASQTASGVGDMLVDLFERTGVHSCCLFSRSNATDAALPAIQDSDNSRDFFQHALGKGFFDILLKFEQWSCTRDTEAKDLDDVQSMRKQIVLLILEGLRSIAYKIKNKKNVDMDYINYKVDVMHKFGVELAGWPSDIPFKRPVKLTADQGREIHDGLRCGAICWVVMMKSQREELAEEIEELGGVAALKHRKMYSDKGKGKANNSDSEDEDGEDGEDNEDNEDDEDEEDEEIPQRKSTATAASSRSKSGADTRSRNSTATASSSCKSGMGACRSGAATTTAASRMSPTSGGTPVAIAATAGTNPTPSSTAALLTNLIPTAVLTNDVPGPNTALGVPTSTTLTHNLAGHNIAPTGVIPAATGPTTGAMDHAIYDFNNGMYNFNHAVYNFDFSSMDLTTLSNPSASDANIFLGTNVGGHTDACGMSPLPYTFPPVDSLAEVMGSDLYGMPPLPNSFDVYEMNSRHGPNGLGNAYDLPRLPNPNTVMHEDGTLFEPASSAASTNRPVGGVLEEATNVEQAVPWKRGHATEGMTELPPAKKSGRDAMWTAVTFSDDAQPKGKRRQSCKKKDVTAA